MKEVDFKDRVSLNPGKIRLVPIPNEPDCFIMERADEPTEQGTPIDKATFNSIIHSRLTGRYYAPSIIQNEYNIRSGVTASPLPTSDWIYETDNTNKATNGAFAVESSSNNGNAWLVDKAFNSNGWQSMGGNSSWLKIYHSAAIKVRKITASIYAQYTARLLSFTIQGSTNGTVWDDLATFTTITSGTKTDFTITNPGAYMYYQLVFENTDSNRITVSNLAYSLFDVVGYNNAFIVDTGLPTVWTKEQRITIVTPSFNIFGVNGNTLNNVNINTVLLPNRRYELRYNGSAFDTKEV